MRRIFFSLLVLLLCFSANAQEYDYCAGAGGTAAGCGATSEPAGDVFSDGFETATTGYEATKGENCTTAPTWCEDKTVNPALTLSGLSGGTGDTKNCTQGLNISVGTNTAYAQYRSSSAIANVYTEFSIYVDTEGLSNYGTATIFAPASTSGAASDLLGQVSLYQDGSGNIQIYASAATTSTKRTISLDTWYYVRVFMSDASESGTLTVGTTYGGTDIANADTFTCNDVTTNPSYFVFGVRSSATINYTFGYIAVDDDGTF
jgi:hypothetical protein